MDVARRSKMRRTARSTGGIQWRETFVGTGVAAIQAAVSAQLPCSAHNKTCDPYQGRQSWQNKRCSGNRLCPKGCRARNGFKAIGMTASGTDLPTSALQRFRQLSGEQLTV